MSWLQILFKLLLFRLMESLPVTWRPAASPDSLGNRSHDLVAHPTPEFSNLILIDLLLLFGGNTEEASDAQNV